ncbi:MAG: sensor histidine kinase, partial [Exiguobacterium acetylicum]
MKRQILMRFMTIITVTVLLVIGILSFVTYNYYYVTATDVLKRHANASAVLFANSGLAYDYADSEATIHDVLDSYAYPDAEIEVLDATGIPRYSSTGFISERKLTRAAVNQVRAGQTVTKRYDDEATGEHLLEVTEPVVSFGQTTGALRYTTSLERIDRRVIEICLAIVLLGTVIWGLAFIYSS